MDVTFDRLLVAALLLIVACCEKRRFEIFTDGRLNRSFFERFYYCSNQRVSHYMNSIFSIFC